MKCEKYNIIWWKFKFTSKCTYKNQEKFAYGGKKRSQNLYIIMRTSVELFKSVILRTKSFKVFILLILVISCLIIQLNNDNENIIDNKINEDENSLFDDHDDYEKPGLEIDLNNPYAGITKDESSSNDAKVSQIFQK